MKYTDGSTGFTPILVLIATVILVTYQVLHYSPPKPCTKLDMKDLNNPEKIAGCYLEEE